MKELIQYQKSNSRASGFTLVELIVAVGLFALVMTLVSGAYIVMIGLTNRAQGAATGIDNLSFALETMTRSIRTGTDYNCGAGGNCPDGSDSFLFTDSNGDSVTFKQFGSGIQETKGAAQSILTDPSINISSLKFYVSGTGKDDSAQPHVTIAISGTVFVGSGKPPQSFAIETGATMRGVDIGITP